MSIEAVSDQSIHNSDIRFAGRETREVFKERESSESIDEDKRAENGESVSEEGELSEEEVREVENLKKRDQEVKAHERAHLAAAQGLAVSGAQFEYKRGPDGVMYAVGGEVSIDVSEVKGDPQKTVEKAQKIQRAALAPAEPSAQDRKVAQQAAVMEAEARAELASEKMETSGKSKDSSESGVSSEIEYYKKNESEPGEPVVDFSV